MAGHAAMAWNGSRRSSLTAPCVSMSLRAPPASRTGHSPWCRCSRFAPRLLHAVLAVSVALLSARNAGRTAVYQLRDKLAGDNFVWSPSLLQRAGTRLMSAISADSPARFASQIGNMQVSGFDAEILQKVHALPAAPGSLHASAAVGAIGIMVSGKGLFMVACSMLTVIPHGVRVHSAISGCMSSGCLRQACIGMMWQKQHTWLIESC